MRSLVTTVLRSRRLYAAQWVAFIGLAAAAAKKAADVTARAPTAP